jgi:hypothetical protein
MQLNANKTAAVLFSHKRTSPTRTLKLNGTNLKWENKAKYLGVTINRTLNFGPHIDNIIRRATKVRGSLYPVLNRKSAIPMEKRIRLLSMYVTPILTYAGAAWAPFITPTQWKRIEAVQTIGLRTITGSPNFLRNEVLRKLSRKITVKENIKKQAKSMFYINSLSSYKHIRELGRSPTPNQKTKNKPKPRPLTWAQSTN